MNTPSDLKYTKEHEWVKEESAGLVVFGITDFAQSALGDIVFASLPKVGTKLNAGQVNEKLANNPEILNSDPYGAGWMIKLSDVDTNEFSALLDATGYQKITENA